MRYPRTERFSSMASSSSSSSSFSHYICTTTCTLFAVNYYSHFHFQFGTGFFILSSSFLSFPFVSFRFFKLIFSNSIKTFHKKSSRPILNQHFPPRSIPCFPFFLFFSYKNRILEIEILVIIHNNNADRSTRSQYSVHYILLHALLHFQC